MTFSARLAKLARLWPPAPCPACRDRPAMVCIAEGEEPPVFTEGPCPACGHMRWSIPVLVGVDCDAL